MKLLILALLVLVGCAVEVVEAPAASAYAGEGRYGGRRVRATWNDSAVSDEARSSFDVRPVADGYDVTLVIGDRQCELHGPPPVEGVLSVEPSSACVTALGRTERVEVRRCRVEVLTEWRTVPVTRLLCDATVLYQGMVEESAFALMPAVE